MRQRQEIWTQVIDYSRSHPEENLREVNYAQLKSGTITIRGKEVPTGCLSSYPKAMELANILRDSIKAGDFLLTQSVASLPGPETGCTFKPLKERPIEREERNYSKNSP